MKRGSICPCVFCRDDRNYRSMHTDYPLTEQEIRHSRRVSRNEWWKSLLRKVFKR